MYQGFIKRSVTAKTAATKQYWKVPTNTIIHRFHDEKKLRLIHTATTTISIATSKSIEIAKAFSLPFLR